MDHNDKSSPAAREGRSPLAAASSTAVGLGSDDDDAAFEQALAMEASQLTPSGPQTKGPPSLPAHVTELPDERDFVAADGEDKYKGDPKGIPEKRDAQLADETLDEQEYLASEAYKPTAFGDFRTYMRNKRMKLKLQEQSMARDEEAVLEVAKRKAEGKEEGESSEPTTSDRPPLFAGSNIYINGHTIPPYAELRRLIHLFGGELMPYLDQKSPVTHIVASNLTAKKRIEFKDYRVVFPSWITESIAAGRRLDWRDYRCTEDATGTLQAGALGSRRSEVATPETATHASEGTARSVPADWRAAAANMHKDGDSLATSHPFAVSGSGLGGAGGVGPWGGASRQKSLGKWARRLKQEQEAEMGDKHPEAEMVQQAQVQDIVPNELRLENREKPPNLSSSIALQRETSENTTGVGKGLARIQVSATNPEVALPVTPTISGKSNEKTFTSLGTDPPTEAAAIAAGLRHPSHPYASRPSNSKAAQLMASPSWRERNTATGEGFLAGYFGKSRLHHLSTWKSEMREMVGQALREANRAQGSVDLPKGVHRVIMHIDFDAFFVSVGLRSRPELREKAVVVCHADSDTGGNSSTSEIASCNYIARTHGVRNGMSLGQARRHCTDVCTIPYDFKAYNDIAISFYTFLLSHADAIEAVSIDEALVDVSVLLEEMRQGKDSTEPARYALMSAYKGNTNSQGQQWTEERQLAEAMRDEIRTVTGCEASIGIGSNVLLARLATRKAKPGGSFHLQDKAVDDFVDELDIDDLHGVGWSIRNRCRDVFGSCNVGELKKSASKSRFIAQFGEKHGVTIWDKLHGRERSRLESVKQRQSCGAAVNYAIRFQTEIEVRDFIYKLCTEVSSRLQAIGLIGKVCSTSLMVRSKDAPVEAPKFLGHGVCDTFNRSAPLRKATDDAEAIFETAWKLIVALHIQPDQMRGIGVSLQKLGPKDGSEAVPRREIGQRALSFGQATKYEDAQTATIAELTQNPQDDPEILEDRREKDILGSVEVSPSANRAARREEQRADKQQLHESPSQSKNPSPEPDFPSTQFAIPPMSQLDPAVVAALPASIQAQIRRSESSSEAKETTKRSSTEDVRHKDAPSLPVTPRKDKQKEGLDLFSRMRAASITPGKKGTQSSRHRPTASRPSSVPSTPSGSQKRARQMDWEPTWSQIDHAVLAELPDEVRADIMRQFGVNAGSSRAATAAAQQMKARAAEDDSPTKGAAAALLEQKGLADVANRSHSESPRKRQAYLDVPGMRRRLEQPALQGKGGHSDALPPLLPRGAATASAGLYKKYTQAVPPKLDPTTVSRETLVTLDIDPDVFAALPLSMQGETLEQQTSAVADRKARFKSGRHAVGTTLAQFRLQQRKLAMAGEGENDSNLRARPCVRRAAPQHARGARGSHRGAASTLSKAEEPSIKGLSSLDEVRGLLSSWFTQFCQSGPRQRDVQRISRFLVECLARAPSAAASPRDASKDYRARTRSATATMSDNDSAVLRAQDIEKVHGLLRWWAHLLASHEWVSGQTSAQQAWHDALASVKADVDAVVRSRLSASLSLGADLQMQQPSSVTPLTR